MRAGFTFIELLIVISIIIIIAGVILPAYNYFITSNVLASTKYEVIQNIRFAQTKALNAENNSNYGVYFLLNSYVLYQGNTYTSRTTSQDQIFLLPDNVEASHLTEINFAKKTGLPNIAGSLILTNSVKNSAETITINAAGLIY